MTKNSALEKVIAKINKKLGDDTIVVASKVTDYGRITTGSLALDVALGGGWSLNKWHEIIGEQSNGKTALALKTIAANQKKDPNFTTIWVAAEDWVPSHAQMCGVDSDRVHVITTNILEVALDAVIEITESKEIDCIVIDSLPALLTKVEEEKVMEDAIVGVTAKQLNKFWRKISFSSQRSALGGERPFLGIVINQFRSKIGVMYGDPRTTPGGEGKNYHFATRLEVKRDDWVTDGNISVGGKTEPRKVGQTIKVRVIKNKTAVPAQVAVFDFYFDDSTNFKAGEIDYIKEAMALAKLYKIVKRAGAYYRYAERQWQGEDAMIASLREELDLQEMLDKDIREAIKISSKFVPESDEE
jgi:recombination protein RecA